MSPAPGREPGAGPPAHPTAGPAVLATKADLAVARPALAAPVVLVPTMGALHAGHAALLRSGAHAGRARPGA